MGIKISALAAAGAADSAMQFEVNSAGTSQRLTLAQMFALSMGAVTVDTPLLNMAQTWNAGAVTFTGWKLNVTDTASAAASRLFDLQLGGSSKLGVQKDGRVFWNNQSGTGIDTAAADNNLDFWVNGLQLVRLANSSPREVRFGDTTKIGWGSSFSGLDTVLARDTANSLALRNGSNGQVLSIYGTYTDAGNWERVYLYCSTTAAYLHAQKAGTGQARELKLGTNDVSRWIIAATAGHLTAGVDNTYDIGAAGATRPRTLYLGTSAYVGANQILSTRQTGWTAATGTATRTTFATGSVTLSVLAEHVKALIDDLITHGLIGT